MLPLADGESLKTFEEGNERSDLHTETISCCVEKRLKVTARSWVSGKGLRVTDSYRAG